MQTKIEPLEDGNTRISIPIEFRYDNGRKRIFFPEMPDERLEINESLSTGIARAYRWQELLDNGEYDSPEALFTPHMFGAFCVWHCSLLQSWMQSLPGKHHGHSR